MFIDLSWVVFEDYILLRDEEGDIQYDDDGDARIREEWVDLIEKYPNNFILGSDIVADFRKYHSEIRKYNALLMICFSGRWHSRWSVRRDSVVRFVG